MRNSRLRRPADGHGRAADCRPRLAPHALALLTLPGQDICLGVCRGGVPQRRSGQPASQLRRAAGGETVCGPAGCASASPTPVGALPTPAPALPPLLPAAAAAAQSPAGLSTPQTSPTDPPTWAPTCRSSSRSGWRRARGAARWASRCCARAGRTLRHGTCCRLLVCGSILHVAGGARCACAIDAAPSSPPPHAHTDVRSSSTGACPSTSWPTASRT